MPENAASPANMSEIATRIRLRVLDMCTGRGQGYAGQGLALADVLAQLYFRVMRRRDDGSYLDRFVLSTGHSAIGLFATLGEVGLYSQDELHTYGRWGRACPRRSGSRSASGCAGPALRSTACCRMANCRRARSGRRRCQPATTGLAT